MVDRIGYRTRIGVIVPSFNTSVQPELEAMRPPGVANHVARIEMPDGALTSDDEQAAVIDQLGADLFGSVRRVMGARPAAVVMGISIPTFWGGVEAAERMRHALDQAASVPVVLGSQAAVAALRCYPGVRRLGIITPYQPVGDAHVRRYFEQCGFIVSTVHSLRPRRGSDIALVDEADLIATLRTAAAGVDAVMQVGTNLAMGDLCAEAERWLGLPVISINTALYWAALRAAGIGDQVRGFGSLLQDH
jgi:maleate isomerase